MFVAVIGKVLCFVISENDSSALLGENALPKSLQYVFQFVRYHLRGIVEVCIST